MGNMILLSPLLSVTLGFQLVSSQQKPSSIQLHPMFQRSLIS